MSISRLVVRPIRPSLRAGVVERLRLGVTQVLPDARPEDRARPVTTVPAPGTERTSSSPPRDPIRSDMLRMPIPRRTVVGSNPMPSSRTENVTSSTERLSVTVSADACAYFEAFCIASRQQKYTAISTDFGSRPTSRTSSVTGTAARFVCRVSAPSSPSSARTGGYPPRVISRRPSRASCVSARSSSMIAIARSGSFTTNARASPAFTPIATSCCCAPSWMFRSMRRRSASAASTSVRCLRRPSMSNRSRRRASRKDAPTAIARKASCPPPSKRSATSSATPAAPTSRHHAPATAIAARRSEVNVEVTRLASDRARAGTTQARAFASDPGTTSAEIARSGTHVATTAIVRASATWKPETGVDLVVSNIGSAHGPYAAATPATGISGATTRNAST